MDDSESIWEHSSTNYNSPNKQIRGKNCDFGHCTRISQKVLISDAIKLLEYPSWTPHGLTNKQAKSGPM